MASRALIFGIGGQDGSYLAESLLKDGWEVHGTSRRSSADNLFRIRHIVGLNMHVCELTDVRSIHRVLEDSQPDVVYNMADQDDVRASFHHPEEAIKTTALAVMSILEAVKDQDRRTRVFQPISATIFGSAPGPQWEHSDRRPSSPYALAKSMALDVVTYYRRNHKMYVSAGILYNHDSPRRGSGYFLHSLARRVITLGINWYSRVNLPNPDQRINVGYAGDFVKGIRDMMELENPADLCLCSNNSLTALEWFEAFLSEAGLSYGKVAHRVTTDVDPNARMETLWAECKLAKALIGWDPKTSANDLVGMVYREERRRSNQGEKSW